MLASLSKLFAVSAPESELTLLLPSIVWDELGSVAYTSKFM